MDYASTELSYPYCTVEDVQTETVNDRAEIVPVIQHCINEASRWVDGFTGRDFLHHDHSASPYYIVPRGSVIGDALFFPWPVISVASIWVYTDRALGPGSNDLVAAGDYYVDDENQSCIRHVAENGFAEYGSRIFVRVAGVFGHVFPSNTAPPTGLPPGIRRATTLIASAWSRELRTEQIGLDGSTVSLLDSRVPAEAKMLLSQFKRRSQTDI